MTQIALFESKSILPSLVPFLKMLSMNENIYKRIQALTPDEALEIISKMGMNMHDHPYLSEERRQEMENEMVDDLPTQKPLSKENGDSDARRI